MGAAQVAYKGAVLEPLQTVVETGIGYFLACSIVRNVVDHQTLHRSPPHDKRCVDRSLATYKCGDMPRLALQNVPDRLALAFIGFG